MARETGLEKLLSSIFRDHIDPETSEPRENSEDIEKKYNKILELINGEQGDANLSANMFDKLELISCLENFAKGYQALCRRYDDLVGKIKKKVHHKIGEPRSFSFTFSDSDSDPASEVLDPASEVLDTASEVFPSRDKSEVLLLVLIDDKAKILELRNSSVELQKALMDAIAVADQNLKLLTEDLSSKDGDLNSEILSPSDRIQEDKMTIRDLTFASDMLTYEHSKLLNGINELNHELKAKDDGNHDLELKQTEAEGQIMELEVGLELLNEDSFILQQCESKLLESEKIINDIRAEIKLLRNELLNEVDALTLKLETANLQVADLNKETEVAGQQSMLPQNNKDLCSQNYDLGRRSEEALAEVLALQVKLKAVTSEANGKIQDMAMHEKDLQSELELLRVQKEVWVEHMNAIRDLLSDNESLIKNLHQDTLTSNISQQRTVLKDLKCSSYELLNSCEKQREHFQELQTKLEAAELVCKAQAEERSKLMKDHNEMMEKLAARDAEKMAADKKIENLKQKVKITKSQCRALAEENQLLLGHWNSYVEIDLLKLKKAVQIGVSKLGEEFQNLQSFFEENRTRFLTHVSECTEELKLLRAVSDGQLQERQQDPENKMQELAAELQNKEEQIDLLQAQVRNLKITMVRKGKLQHKQMEEMGLLHQKKIQELEQRTKEKEEEIVVWKEEKSGVVRRLSFLIDSLRENPNNQ